MIKVYRHDDLGQYQTYWLDSRHHFSFGEYKDPDRVQFGNLRVINDDAIRPGTGFDFHPHQDMEIITYVREGTIIHKDNLGNEGRTKAGDVQVMSAGTGIVHAEHADPELETKIFQIWILPNEKGVLPRWDAAEFPKAPVIDKLNLLVSGRDGDKDKKVLSIHQNAAIYGGKLSSGTELIHTPGSDKDYALVSQGTVWIDGKRMEEGDGAEITNTESVTIESVTDSEILMIEV